LQVVIALVITTDGFPLAYEVMDGNTSDRTPQSRPATSKRLYRARAEILASLHFSPRTRIR
jgi:hypothetical protein